MIVDKNTLAAGAALFAIDPNSYKSIGGTDGAVYACRKGSLGHVIKFIPMPEEEVDAYKEKVDFFHYLMENGVPVAAPLASLDGRLFERVPGPGQDYTVVLSPLADGRHPTGRNLYDWNERLFRTWGQVMGRMHALAKRYPKWRPSSEGADEPATRISGWREEHDYFSNWCQEAKIVDQWERLRGPLEALPEKRDSFGLIHNDLHMRNIFYDPDARQGSGITVIDFDVCAYHWFLTDIAIALYHAVLEGAHSKGATGRLAFARQFLGEFLTGYEQENHLDEAWLIHLPLFLRYRDILLYIVFSNTWPVASRNRWQVDMMAHMRRRILRDEPVLSTV